MRKSIAAIVTMAMLLAALPGCDVLGAMDPTPTLAPTQGSWQAQPTPTPTPVPSPTATQAPSPSPTPTPSPTPEPTPTPMPKLKGTTGNYLILCETEAQKPIFSEFTAFKQWCGYTVTVKSVEADVKPGAKADASTAIQQYLKRMDKELSLEYVLLVGKPYTEGKACPRHTGGIIPMRYMYPLADNHRTRYFDDWYDYSNPKKNAFNTPTDAYYAFDFKWDYDKDGFAGETNEVAKAAKKAKPALLFKLGRIPFSERDDIKAVLDATVRFEQNRQKESKALISSIMLSYPEQKGKVAGDWAWYGSRLAKNLSAAGIEPTTLFTKTGVMQSKYGCTRPLTPENFGEEAAKSYDFVYTIGSSIRVWENDANKNKLCDEPIADSYYLPEPGPGFTTGIYFMDGFATLEVENDRGIPRIQQYLLSGSACAAIATTRETGFYPDAPAPKPASLMFSKKSTNAAGEFYAAIATILTSRDPIPAYVYCYIGDPSLKLNP